MPIKLPTLNQTEAIDSCQRFTNGEMYEVSINEALVALPSEGSIFWGVSPVAPLHFGYDKIFCLLSALSAQTGLAVHILLADAYAQLSHGTDLDLSQRIGDYYRAYIEDVWELKCQWTYASSFIFSKTYSQRVFQAARQLTASTVKETWTSDDRATQRVYGFLYPMMQNLDVFHLQPTVVLAEASQKKFYSLFHHIARIVAPEIDVTFIFIKQSHDLRGKLLKGSKGGDRLSVHESSETLGKKLSTCAALPGYANCPVTELVLYSLWPFNALRMINPTEGPDAWPLLELQNGAIILPRDFQVLEEGLTMRLEQVEKLYASKTPDLTGWIDFARLRSE